MATSRFEIGPVGPYSLAASVRFLEGFAPTAYDGGEGPGHLPRHEPRLARAVALVYGLDSPPETGEVEKIAERWRPYRTWVSLLPQVALEEETGEIAGSTGKVVSVGRARSGGDV